MTSLPNSNTLEPPDELDDAEVILWAFNLQKPFFIMKYVDGTVYKPIHGFAICRYKKENQYYKFSCDSGWNVEGDSVHSSIEEACKAAKGMSIEPIIWNKKRSSK
jgi:hypothetical protein